VDEAMSPRRREIVATALRILEAEGRDALTMRRLAGEIGMRAPSLYKHFPDKAAVEIALIEIGFTGMAEALEAALERDDDRNGPPLERLATAYRRYALDHPHLYRLLTGEPLPRERLRAGVEDRAAWPLVRVVQHPDHARALWAFAHGMVILELNGRFPPNADIDAAWRAGVEGFAAARR
jgi:AcrR family transcriptional regulator